MFDYDYEEKTAEDRAWRRAREARDIDDVNRLFSQERDPNIPRHLKKKKPEAVKIARGTEVRHTQTDAILMIKKDYGSIVTCYSKRYSEISPGKLTNVELYRKDYLIPTEN
jgi:hypothetical protein